MEEYHIPQPYEGDEPYIFVGYCHKDRETVLPVLKRLGTEGFRFWYDEGITWGSEWLKSIAQHIKRAQVCVFFISQDWAESIHCNQEPAYAVSKKKSLFAIYLEPTRLPEEMEMVFNLAQNSFYYEYRDREELFFQRLFASSPLLPCRETKAAPETAIEPPAQGRTPTAGERVILGPYVAGEEHTLRDGWFLCYTRNIYNEAEVESAREKVRSIRVLDSFEQLPDGITPKQGEVISWEVRAKDTDPERYDLYIAADGQVMAPPLSNCLFAGFTNAERIEVSRLDTSKATSMTAMFSGCASITELDVSGFDTSGVTDMSGMFCNCERLRTVDVSGFDTAKVTDMSGMFCNCKRLRTVDVSGFDTAKVTDMSSMFSQCLNLSRLDVSEFDTSKVKYTNGMFFFCSALRVLDISGFDMSSVEDCTGMFTGCHCLTRVDLSDVKMRRKMLDSSGLKWLNAKVKYPRRFL